MEDAYGNVITSNTSKITLVVNSGPNGFASGSTTVVAAVNGVATFSSLVCDNAGSYQIGASDGSLTKATSATITVAPATASKLVTIETPGSGTAGTALSSLQVAVEDQFGNIVTSNTSTITVTVGSGGSFWERQHDQNGRRQRDSDVQQSDPIDEGDLHPQGQRWIADFGHDAKHHRGRVIERTPPTHPVGTASLGRGTQSAQRELRRFTAL